MSNNHGSLDDMIDPTLWDYTLEEQEREAEIERTRSVNEARPSAEKLTYSSYLGLDELLRAAKPVSRIPDERAFILTHHLCEICFLQMRFDLDVIGNTLRVLIDSDDPLGSDRAEAYWRPALTAAGRLLYVSKNLIANSQHMLGYHDASTFDSCEFSYFRHGLTPSSGFQSAQFRSVQCSFGKANLVKLEAYPVDIYDKEYTGKAQKPRMAAIASEDILRTDFPRFAPVDDLVAELLEKIALKAGEIEDREEDNLLLSNLDTAVDAMRAALSGGDEMSEVNYQRFLQFKSSIDKVISAENERRGNFTAASIGADRLKKSGSPLNRILELITEADDALHYDEDSFLATHLDFVDRRIGEVMKLDPAQSAGTGGGGKPYLEMMIDQLLPNFKALLPFR